MTDVVARPNGASPARELAFPPKPKATFSRRALTVVLLGVLAAAIWSAYDLKVNLATLIDGWTGAIGFLERTAPFTFPPMGELWGMVGQTLAIVVLSTVLGFVLSVPLALLAAKNTTVNEGWRQFARGLIVLERAVPDFVIAVFFVRVFGLGALPGIIALGIGSIGMMAKLYADAIEEVDPGPMQALRAAGASKLQQIMGGVIPQVKAQLIATALHAFDINLRGSVLLGFVGVAGIGMYISAALDTMNYGRGLGLTFVLLIMCLIAELISGIIRRQLLGGHQAPSGSRSLALFRMERPDIRWLRGEAKPGQITPPWNRERLSNTIWSTLMWVLIIGSMLFSGIQLDQLEGGFQKAVETLGLYVPPTTAGIGDKLFATLLETVQMGLAGTLVGLVLAIPFGLLSARNISPHPWAMMIARGLVVTIRAIPGIIVGITFVVVTGLGATAGAFTLAVGAIGFFSKIIADSLEEVDVRVQDAVRTSGAGSGQVFFAATLRQVSPALAAHTMHQLDTNIRAATGLGIIGAGGIGFYINNAQRVLEYGVVTSCVILIVATVLLSEALAMWTRREVQ